MLIFVVPNPQQASRGGPEIMKILLAIDSFKGCLTSTEAEAAAAQGLQAVSKDIQVVSVPASDGGEGMVHAFVGATGGRLMSAHVHDALMRPTEATYGLMPDGTAVVEVAEACGLSRLALSERNPLRATSYGVGELLASALRHGCRRFVVGLGGTATSDAGLGMLRALVDRLAPHGTLDDALAGELGDCSFTLACDVTNPLCGSQGAAAVFAPQKGATPQMVAQLDARAAHFARIAARHFGRDCSQHPGAGAAGGLGYAFMQCLGARAESGARLLLRLAHFDTKLEGAQAVITGEGSADKQTLMGKFPQAVLQASQARGVPVWLVAGHVADADKLREAGFAQVTCINAPSMPLDEALRPNVAKERLANTVRQMAKEQLTGHTGQKLK